MWISKYFIITITIVYFLFIIYKLYNLLKKPQQRKRYKWFSDEPFNTSIKLPSNYTNWMKNLPDTMNTKLLSIPGTHDSCARNFLNETLAKQYYLRCQNWDILSQLNAGIRYFDLRPGENFTIYHYIHTLDNLNDTLETMVNFLNKYPSEFLIVRFQFQNHTCLTNEIEECKIKFTKPVFDKYINYFYEGNDFPMIGKIRGKIFPLIEYFTYENFLDWTKGIDNLFFLQDFYLLLNKKKDIKLKKKLIYEYMYIKNLTKPVINHISAVPNYINSSMENLIILLNEVPFRYNNYRGIFPINFPSEELVRHIIEQNFFYFS